MGVTTNGDARAPEIPQDTLDTLNKMLADQHQMLALIRQKSVRRPFSVVIGQTDGQQLAIAKGRVIINTIINATILAGVLQPATLVLSDDGGEVKWPGIPLGAGAAAPPMLGLVFNRTVQVNSSNGTFVVCGEFID